MNSSISPNDFVELMQDCFSRGQTITFTPSGNSMLPMLDGKSDMVTFSPAPKRLKKYDVALYRRNGNSLKAESISFAAITSMRMNTG